MHLIYVTFPEKAIAIELANQLVKDKLAACVNISENVTSIYEWEGKTQQSTEFTMICKVSDELVDKTIKTITSAHPYDCPCVIAIKVAKGNDNFIKWVENSCKVPY